MTETIAGPLTITEPGIYDLPADVYHADPVPAGSLSSSGARLLLPPSTPAHFRWAREHPRPSTPAMDFGRAAHRIVLGVGEELVEVQADSWRTKAAQQAADEARAAGKTPLLTETIEQARDMAAALREHVEARILFDPDHGQPERSLFAWTTVPAREGQPKPVTFMRRCRLDWLPDPRRPGRYIVPEYKTCTSADPEALAKVFAQYWYPQQAEWNLWLVRALGIADQPRMVFVCQEKTPPYLVNIVEPDVIAMRAAAVRNREAIETYARCTATGKWPGYGHGVTPLALPLWIEREYV